MNKASAGDILGVMTSSESLFKSGGAGDIVELLKGANGTFLGVDDSGNVNYHVVPDAVPNGAHGLMTGEQATKVNNAMGKFEFGDGSDGDVIISVDTTLTASKYYNNLTINQGITLKTGNFRIFVKGTFTNNGALSASGPNGGSSTGTAVGAAGAANNAADVGGGSTGGAGLIGVTGAGTQGTAGGASTGMGGTGGAGGTGGNGVSLGGGSRVATTITLRMCRNLTERPMYGTAYIAGGSGGSGGASGGGDGTNLSGGGGGGGTGGGVLLMYANTIVNSATGAIVCYGGNGGNGGQPVTGNTGGGGGGAGAGGGLIYLVYSSITNDGNISVAGGTGGTGGQPRGTGLVGGNGGNGTAGYILRYNVTSGVWE